MRKLVLRDGLERDNTRFGSWLDCVKAGFAPINGVFSHVLTAGSITYRGSLTE